MAATSATGARCVPTFGDSWYCFCVLDHARFWPVLRAILAMSGGVMAPTAAHLQ